MALDRDFIQGNILDQIRDLRNQLETLQRTAVTATTVDVYPMHYLTVPLTSTSWDGDAKSDAAKTLLDLSAVFGAPAGIKAVLFYVGLYDSDAAATDTYMILSPNNTANQGFAVSAMPVADRGGRYCVVCPCNADGDVYYQIQASGAGTMDVWLEIWGYAL